MPYKGRTLGMTTRPGPPASEDVSTFSNSTVPPPPPPPPLLFGELAGRSSASLALLRGWALGLSPPSLDRRARPLTFSLSFSSPFSFSSALSALVRSLCFAPGLADGSAAAALPASVWRSAGDCDASAAGHAAVPPGPRCGAAVRPASRSAARALPRRAFSSLKAGKSLTSKVLQQQ